MSYRGKSKGSYGSFRQAQKIHARRSSKAKRIDEGLRAPLAKSPSEWMEQPNRLDLQEIDVPKQQEHEERKRQETEDFYPEPKPITHRSVQHGLAVHRLCGATH